MSKLIPLTQDKHAIIDDEDYDYLMQWRWCFHKHGYAIRTQWIRRKGVPPQSTSIKMHRLILGLSERESRLNQVDHVNGNRLDNRRCNLRICTPSQNAMNRPPRKGTRSQYKGVHWHKQNKKWTVTVCINGKKHYVGIFASELEAAHAHDEAARVYHGEFAKLNF